MTSSPQSHPMRRTEASPEQRRRALGRLHKRADQVTEENERQERLWDKGFSRRRFIAGAGMAGVAAIGTQLVTTRVAYSATPAATDRTLIVMFLRGGADGLRVLIPNSSDLGLDTLTALRPNLLPAVADRRALAGATGWAVNKGLDPILPLWSTGELAFVPAVSSLGVSRSHFQAQQFLETGGQLTSPTGWLDRTLGQMGAGTTFRALSMGSAEPMSMLGPENDLVMSSLSSFTFPGSSSLSAASQQALSVLYRGMSGPLGQDVPTTLAALGTAATARASAGPANGASYPSGNVGQSLADLATVLKAEVGVEVATLDVAGWDTHTDEASDLDANLAGVASALAAFMQDLGPTRRQRVTVAVMTEFGRRVTANGSGGTDHGHGSVMWLLGGGLSKASVFGNWNGLSTAALDQGDVPGTNDAFDVLGELITKRLGIGTLSSIFPGHTYNPLGVATAA